MALFLVSIWGNWCRRNFWKITLLEYSPTFLASVKCGPYAGDWQSLPYRACLALSKTQGGTHCQKPLPDPVWRPVVRKMKQQDVKVEIQKLIKKTKYLLVVVWTWALVVLWHHKIVTLLCLSSVSFLAFRFAHDHSKPNLIWNYKVRWFRRRFPKGYCRSYLALSRLDSRGAAWLVREWNESIQRR